MPAFIRWWLCVFSREGHRWGEMVQFGDTMPFQSCSKCGYSKNVPHLAKRPVDSASHFARKQ